MQVMAIREIRVTTRMSGYGVRSSLAGTLYGGEALAHKFIVTDADGGSFSGTVSAKFIRMADDVTVPLTGAIENGAATVTLSANCYYKPGRFVLTIFVTFGGSTTEVYSCSGNVALTDGETTIDPSGEIALDVSALIAEIEEAQASIPADYSAMSADVTRLVSADNIYRSVGGEEASMACSVSEGRIVGNSSTTVSGFIPVEPNAVLSVNQHLNSSIYGHFFYDRNKTRVGSVASGSSNLTFTVPSTAYYVRFTILTSTISSFVCTGLTKYPAFNVHQAMDIDDNLNLVQGRLYGNIYTATGTTLLTNSDISAGEILYYSFEAEDGAAGYLDILNTSNTRIVYIGKGSSTGAVNAFEGAYLIPSGFGKIVTGGSGGLKNLYLGTKPPYKKVVNDLNGVANAIDASKVTSGYAFQTSGYRLVSLAAGAVTDYIAVKPGQTVTLNSHLSSTTYGHVFYDADKTPISAVNANADNLSITVPSDAAYIRCSLLAASLNSTVILVSDHQQTANEAADEALRRTYPYSEREVIKAVADDLGGVGQHVAFPAMCYYAGKMYILARYGYQHLTPTNPAQWGGMRIWTRTMDGKLTKLRDLTAANFSGLSGELRDSKILPTRDGRYLILTGWTTYYSGETPVHDNLIAVLDASANVVSYKVFTGATYMLWGNPLHTPEGRIIVCAYNTSGTVVLYRTGVISSFADISGISLTSVTLAQDTTYPATEATVGYFNDKLVAMIRRENAAASLYTQTSNLEGGDGWSTPVAMGIKLNAPVLLPYCAGDKIVFAGAYLDHYTSDADRLRYACIGLYDPATNTALFGNVDEAIDGYSGYCGLVKINDSEYGIVYYLEKASTGLYYKKVNIRALIPQMNFWM